MGRFEIRLSGAGGQGMILAGIILAEAVLYEEGLHVTQTQSYGPESRGGASRAEVVLSLEEIDYPKVVQPDILVALTQEAFNKYSLDVKDGGIIIADEQIDITGQTARNNVELYTLPIIETAEKEVGLQLTSNIVVLGIINNFIANIRTASLEKAISDRVPAHTRDINLKAFYAGRELIK